MADPGLGNQIVTTLGPIVGVVVGAVFGRVSARKQFVQDRSMSEVQHRRTVYADYLRALWAYQSRVFRARDLAASFERAEAENPGKQLTIQYNLNLTMEKQAECRDALASINLFASTPAQNAARDAMTALSLSHDAIRQRLTPESDRYWAEYEAAHERFALAVNEEVAHMNALLYAYMTPVWRVVVGKALRKPLPFEVGGAPPEAPTDPQPNSTHEGVVAQPGQ
ncbi:hypothetical protein ACIA58_31345 [Kribbella sp. NPDC051586]|uniref:hypothetical protein n=1 Tax=Kribbella sp. NPDC051586 TaxID=3364118 RepID=UPI00378BA2F3